MTLAEIARRQIHRDARCKIVSVIPYVLANDLPGQIPYVLVIRPVGLQRGLIDRGKYSFVWPTGQRLEPLGPDHHLREVLQAVGYLHHAHQTAIQTNDVELLSVQRDPFYFPYQLGQSNRIETIRLSLAQEISEDPIAVAGKDEHVMIDLRLLAINTVLHEIKDHLSKGRQVCFGHRALCIRLLSAIVRLD